MTTEQHVEALRIDGMRNRLKEQLEQLGRPSITVSVHYTSGHGSSLFKTIGTGEGCEHPDAEAARSFTKQLIQRRQDELDDLDQQFRNL